MYELKGSVKVVNETAVISDKFKKREFVITDDSSQYPQDIAMQLTQDNCDKLNGVNVGDRLLVKFNLRGRAWNDPKTGKDRYFNSLDAWFIQKESADSPVKIKGGIESNFMEDAVASNVSDDLPF
jgi:hypothetical protein